MEGLGLYIYVCVYMSMCVPGRCLECANRVTKLSFQVKSSKVCVCVCVYLLHFFVSLHIKVVLVLCHL